MIDFTRPHARLIGGALVGAMVLGSAVGAVAACPGFATQGTVKVVFSNLP